MTLLIAAALTLSLVVFLLEGLRRSGFLGQAKPWTILFGLSVPLLFGAYVWSDLRVDCTPRPPMLDMDLESMSLEERRNALIDLRDETSDRLKQCGGTEARWSLYLRLETLVEELDAQIASDLLGAA